MTHLNCSDYTSSLSSTSNILTINQDRLIEILALIPDTPDLSNNYHHCFDELLAHLNYEPKQLTAIWFHGTRILSVDSFFDNGLLPKADGYKILEPILRGLSANVEKTGSSPFSLSKLGKICLGNDDEGPFAALFKQRAQHEDYHFTQCPEAVEDIAGELAGANYHLITEKFIAITKPALVEFIGHADNGDLISTLYFLHQIIHGESEIETACRINAFFKGEGKTIPGKKIKQIHLLDDNRILQNKNWVDT